MAQLSQSVWAQPQDTPYYLANPALDNSPAPSVWAQPDAEPQPTKAPGLDLHAGLTPVFPPVPQVTLDPNPQHQIQGAMKNGNADEGMMLHSQNKLAQDYAKDVSPWGTPENHPGVLGKIAHVLSTVGQTVGDVLQPDLMTRIPGTKMHRQAEEQSLAKDITGQQTEEAENALRGAQTKKEEATTPTPEEQALAPQLTQAEIDEHNAQTATLLHPQAKTDFEAWQQQNPGKPIEDWLKEVKSNTPGNDFEQYYKDYLTDNKLPDSSHNRMLAREQWAAASQAPQRAPVVNMFVPNPNGGETLQTVRPGQTIAPGAQTAAGVNALNTPTTTQRTAAGRAETVIEMAPEVLGRIDSMKGDLGPVAGRWDEFMQGKVGAPNQQFAQLRSDLLMMSSAVALAHAQGRLPENLRLEFDHAINAPHQTAENLKGTIQTMIPWLQKMQQQGKSNAQPGEGVTPPPGAKIIKWSDVKNAR